MLESNPDLATIKHVFEQQRANRLTLKKRGAAQRIERLQALRTAITRRVDAIDAALHDDLRKEKNGPRNPEINAVLQEIDMAINGLPQWMEPEDIAPSPNFVGNRTYVQYEPRGVVLLLGPWNFPFSLVLAPLVPIIAAGNGCIVKPNELQPHTSSLVTEIIAETFPTNEVACFEGDAALAEALQSLAFDHVFFTGSPAIGKRVMAAAAANLTSVTLELGGKCPAIVDRDYPIADAAGKIAAARFSNAGQLCLSVDHVWVPSSRVEEMAIAVSHAIDRMFYENGVFQPARQSRIVNERNFTRVCGYVDQAVSRGARLARGGSAKRAELTIEPTVIVDPPLDSDVMQQEIFGPVLPVVGYDDLGTVTDHIDATGKPLAMYLFSDDTQFTREVLERTSSGGVTINHVLMHYAEHKLPFGGVNGSGMGRYKGVYGFRELSNVRSVFVYKNG